MLTVIALLLTATVYVCELPGGSLVLTRFLTEDGVRQRAIIERLTQDGTLPPGGACWQMAANQLPPKAERARWRRGPGDTVIVPGRP